MKGQKTKKRYTKGEKIALVREYLLSGESIYFFARGNGIPYSNIKRWEKEFGEDLLKTEEASKTMTPEERIKQLEAELKKERLSHKKTQADLEFQQLVSRAWERMVDLAEETYHIKIKKKLRCQVIEEAVEEESGARQTSNLCKVFSISRQGYYQHTDRLCEIDILKTSLVLYCQALRDPDKLPRSGCRQLYELCCGHFKEKMTIGRDQFYDLLRANNLMLRRPRYIPRTTNSNHNYYIYPDLLNTTPKYLAPGLGTLVVADITYVLTDTGWAYLSLVTDAYSRAVVGYALHPTLDTQGPLKAMVMALNFFKTYKIDTSSLIHHSDRGSQYCSNAYVNLLKENNIRISMTQCGDPLHNALAERMNNTIKNGWLFDCEGESFQKVKEKIDNAVIMYNTVRPHQSLGMRTPMSVVECHYHEIFSCI